MVTISQEAADMLKTKVDGNSERGIRVFLKGMG
jgi:hypothetical protein